MKRVTAILFLLVLLFNLAGYQLVIGVLENRNDNKLMGQLDSEAYNAADLVSIKTALNLPYYSNSEQYERVDGTIEVDGIEYKYVKRRIFNDSLELLCLPNTGKEQLQTAKLDFFKLSNDWQSAPDGKKTSGTLKNVLPEFCQEMEAYQLHPLAVAPLHYAERNATLLPDLYTKAQDRPPEAHAI